MPRLARVVIPDISYHITQRGNRRDDVFFCDEDREFYLALLKGYCLKYAVEVWAYCLMANHIHLILRPSDSEGLQKVLKPLHMRYAQYINKSKVGKGTYGRVVFSRRHWMKFMFIRRFVMLSKTL